MRGPDGIKLKKKRKKLEIKKRGESMDGGRKGVKEGGMERRTT